MRDAVQNSRFAPPLVGTAFAPSPTERSSSCRHCFRPPPPLPTSPSNTFCSPPAGYYPASPDFVSSACWADDLKSSGAMQEANWHFIDIPLVRQPFSGQVVQPGTSDTNPWAINGAQSTTYSSKSTLLDKSRQLRFLVHLVGDAHQPLHAATLYSNEFPNSASPSHRRRSQRKRVAARAALRPPGARAPGTCAVKHSPSPCGFAPLLQHRVSPLQRLRSLLAPSSHRDIAHALLLRLCKHLTALASALFETCLVDLPGMAGLYARAAAYCDPLALSPVATHRIVFHQRLRLISLPLIANTRIRLPPFSLLTRFAQATLAATCTTSQACLTRRSCTRFGIRGWGSGSMTLCGP